VKFIGATFVGNADFSGAHFSGEGTSFREAHFSGVGTSFEQAHFSGVQTSFSGAQFSGALTSFEGVQFGSTETRFQEATFAEEVYFSGVTFSEKVTFWGTQGNRVFGPGAWAHFDRPRIEKPELLTFNTVLLHPGWFINADVRKVDFTDVKWYGMPGGPEGTLDEEISALKKRGVESPNTLLAQACRRLSANAEENREYSLANEFHYWSMDALRIGSWSVLYEALLKEEVLRDIKKREQRDIKLKDLWPPNALDVRALLRKDAWHHIEGRRRFGLVNSLYWALSGYGVRAGRALGVLTAMAVVFAVLYMLFGPDTLRISSASNFWQAVEHGGQAIVYSLSTMARLNPEPKPDSGLFQFLVTVEGILGPLQIALFALAVRRKVMR
jgi:hypothetical protein